MLPHRHEDEERTFNWVIRRECLGEGLWQGQGRVLLQAERKGGHSVGKTPTSLTPDLGPHHRTSLGSPGCWAVAAPACISRAQSLSENLLKRGSQMPFCSRSHSQHRGVSAHQRGSERTACTLP